MTPTNVSLEKLEQVVRRNARWTTALLLLFIALVVAAGVFGYVQARQLLSPDRLAGEAEGYIERHYPEWRADVRDALVQAAPGMARRMRRHAARQLPQTRSRLERFLDEEARAGIAKAQVIAEQDFRTFLKDNEAEIRKGFNALTSAPAEVPRFTEDLEGRMDRQLGVSLRKEAGVVLETIDRLNAKLARLAEGKDLSETEKLERRITQELRALQKKGEEQAQKAVSQGSK